jgi:hypothetical protein
MHSPMHQLEEPRRLLHVGADDPEDLLPSRSRQDLSLKASKTLSYFFLKIIFDKLIVLILLFIHKIIKFIIV